MYLIDRLEKARSFKDIDSEDCAYLIRNNLIDMPLSFIESLDDNSKLNYLISSPEAISKIDASSIDPQVQLRYCLYADKYPHLTRPPELWENNTQGIIDKCYNENNSDLMRDLDMTIRHIIELGDSYPKVVRQPPHSVPKQRKNDGLAPATVSIDDVMENNSVKIALEGSSNKYSKSEGVILSLPNKDDIGNINIECKFDEGEVKVDRVVEIEQHHVYMKFNDPIAEDSYGSKYYRVRAVPAEEIREEFTSDAIEDLIEAGPNGFIQKNRKIVIRAFEITPEIMESLTGIRGSDKIAIDLPWLKEPVMAKVGDYLSDQGYPVRQGDILDYDLVADNKLELNSRKPSASNSSLEI